MFQNYLMLGQESDGIERLKRFSVLPMHKDLLDLLDNQFSHHPKDIYLLVKGKTENNVNDGLFESFAAVPVKHSMKLDILNMEVVYKQPPKIITFVEESKLTESADRVNRKFQILPCEIPCNLLYKMSFAGLRQLQERQLQVLP
eukprot:759529-Hanusia_phi.AAC.14